MNLHPVREGTPAITRDFRNAAQVGDKSDSTIVLAQHMLDFSKTTELGISGAGRKWTAWNEYYRLQELGKVFPRQLFNAIRRLHKYL